MMLYNKQDLKKDFASLYVQNFALKSSVQAFLLVRKSTNIFENIILSYSDFSPIGFRINGITAHIFFDEVEKILQPILRKYEIAFNSFSTFGRTFNNVEGVDQLIFQTEINSTESFHTIKPAFEQIIEGKILPFLLKFNSLDAVADFLSDKKIEEIVPYITGSILLPKTALILKLTHHTTFAKRLLEFRGILVEYASKESRYEVMLAVYDELFLEDLGN
jgi:hypothetical protein